MTEPKHQLLAFFANVSSHIIVPLNVDALLTGSKAPVFYCVHAITGAGVSDFIALAKEIGESVRFFGIQAPKKVMLASDYDALLNSVASQYAEAIMTFQPKGQINLGGWSSGAMVALEISRKLRVRGRDVGLLVSIDGAPKNTPVAASRAAYTAKFVKNLPLALMNEDAGRLWRRLLFKISRSWKMEITIADVKEDSHPVRGAIDNYLSYPAHQRRFMRALYDAIENTSFGRYEGAVLVYKASIMPAFLSGVAEFWRHVTSDAEIVNVRGTHASLILDPDVRSIAANLRERLVRNEQASRS